MISRGEKEARLKQRGCVVWLYGMSGAGKSTLAAALESRLAQEGYFTKRLDGDDLRAGLNRDLGFDEAGRTENIRRVAEVARLFVQSGIVVLSSFITPRRSHRRMAREIVGAEDFLEVHVSASYALCAQRDPKGLYAKAQSGQLANFTGRDSAFEPPAPDDGALVVDTEHLSVEASLAVLYPVVLARIAFKAISRAGRIPSPRPGQGRRDGCAAK